jgi:phosphoribosylanthranilate isomerase
MPLKMIVKVGKVTNLSDARYCAGMNVDLLGFVTVENQENYLAPKEFQDIRGWLSGPQIVAEIYGLSSASELADIIEHYKPDYLELSKKELPLVDGSLPLIVRWTDDDFDKAADLVNLYALIVDKAQLNNMANTKKSIKLLVEAENLSEVEEVTGKAGVHGIVLNGTQEESPGLKDYDHLSEILERLEVE